MLDPFLAGRLTFSPAPPSKPPLPAGRHLLGIAAERDAVLVVPPGLDPSRPTPLVVLFHGGGGSAEKILPVLEAQAGLHGFLLLAPQSLFPTWDIVIAGNGPDRERLDQALAEVGSHFLVDRRHLAFAGFSDGGSYALSLGLTNGNIVSHIIAFSAGFMSVHAQEGAPRVFIAHGLQDEQLPIATSGRSNAAKLQAAGYDVQYVEFNGTHAVQPPIVSLAMTFFLGAHAKA
ncbi:esterase [Xanthobacter sp. DSM 24535]|uniref:alpha/beta hydrolase n=1 Tax=Roseixanthobacter psychrophilus TaxID=3119917 RepID=UPI0037277CB8